MGEVVQAKCPGCRQVLRVPVDWIGQSLRCKHCGRILSARPKAATPAPSPTPARANGTAPVASAPPPTAQSGPADPFGQLVEQAGVAIPPRHVRRRGWDARLVGAGLLLLLLAGVGGAIAVVANGGPENLLARLRGPSAEPAVENIGRRRENTDLPRPVKDFPRRLLGICVSNYLYANPVSYGEAETSFGNTLKELGHSLHVPDGQLVELSDAATEPHAPLKEVIQGTVAALLESSRPQDHVMIIFVGHGVAIDNEAYLVPIEGELGVKETLIPLGWIYEQLHRCKARQKVLVADVCRVNPGRGMDRPGSAPMAPALDAALKAPPPGVQVWAACVAGQASYEEYVSSLREVHGGIFLGELWEAGGPFDKKRVVGIQNPGDPFRVGVLAEGDGRRPGVNRGTAAAVKDLYGAAQTPRLVGADPPEEPAADLGEPAPASPGIKAPAPPAGGFAPPGAVRAILAETGSLAARENVAPLRPEAMPFFAARALEAYKEERADDTPLREAVREATHILKKQRLSFQEVFRGGDEKKIKAEIAKRQRDPARALAELTFAQEKLDTVAKERKRESKRWRATYDYVRAMVAARFAYVYEYDFCLGQIRKDTLPKRDPAKYSGWRLAAREKTQTTDAKKHGAEARKILLKLAKEHQGTPWEVLAKREALSALGLEWQVTP